MYEIAQHALKHARVVLGASALTEIMEKAIEELDKQLNPYELDQLAEATGQAAVEGMTRSQERPSVSLLTACYSRLDFSR